MALLLAGLPDSVPGVTVNRLWSERRWRGGPRDTLRRDRFCHCWRR